MKRYFLLLSLSSGLLGQIQAQSLEECRTEWNESSANVSDNIRYTSLNPSRISFNSQKNKGVAKLDYTIGRGSYRQVDEAQKENNLRFYMGGIKNVGKVDVSGFISYHNIHENDKIWNSTLYLNKDNPFILCDSVASDVTTEAFKMGVTASCAWNEAWKGGISIGLTLGSLSDQTDPRPKTNTTVLPIYIGAEHRLTSSLSVGATAGISFYNSDITYTLVNTLNSYRYFLMKGMGDYYRISSNDVSGYQRAYKGMNYTGALQFVWEPEQGRCKNFTEVRYTHVSENAIDGGSLYKFYGGYYTSNEWMLQNRFLFSPHRGIRHHIVLTAAYHSGEGTWRDQKMMTATEHGNLIYYETLSKYKIQDDQRMSAQLDYRFEQQKGDNPNFFVDAVAGFTSSVYRHQLSTEKAKQEANLLTAKLSVGKYLKIKSAGLDLSLRGGYRMPLSRTYGDGNTRAADEDIAAVYTRPQFEYETSSHALLGAWAQLSVPLPKKLTLGIYLSTDFKFYTDNNEYYEAFDGTNRSLSTAGVCLQL